MAIHAAIQFHGGKARGGGVPKDREQVSGSRLRPRDANFPGYENDFFHCNDSNRASWIGNLRDFCSDWSPKGTTPSSLGEQHFPVFPGIGRDGPSKIINETPAKYFENST
jgi:hypothetical protein